MAVSLPKAADVRKVRHEAAKNAAERAEAARTPLLAVLGAGDLAVSAVSKVVSKGVEQARTRAAELPQHLRSEELRKAVAELRTQAGQAYAGFAEHGEQTWGRIRTQPQVKDTLSRIESYTEKLDSRVDDLVEDARDAAEKALATVSAQTRTTGERVARVTQRFTGRAAETVAETGDEVARETRATTRKAADTTAPKTEPAAKPEATEAKPAARKPAARRTGSANGEKSGS